MYFYHKKCMEEIYINLSETVLLLGTFSVRKGGIFPPKLSIEFSDSNKFKFYCKSCEKNIEYNEVCGICFKCGKEVSLENIKFGIRYPGFYCNDCEPEGELVKNSLIIDNDFIDNFRR